jgi:TatD DNase family protein
VNAQRAASVIDAHAHLQARQFDGDRAAVLARARAAGVAAIVCAADDEVSSRAAVALAEVEPDVWATVGVHPHEAKDADAGTIARLAELARHPRVVAIGEIGLDYHYDHSPRAVQRTLFAAQLEQLGALGLPVVIHSREAAEDTFAILSAWRAGAVGEQVPGLMHCFGYDIDRAERFLELGFLLSLPGVVTYPKAGQIQQVAAMVPEDRFTVETDCPYLAPQSHRGRRNEPAYLPETVRAIAALRGCSAETVATRAAENTRRLFRLPALTATAIAERGAQ